MPSDYSQMSENCKVWIFPSKRKIHSTEIQNIENRIREFLSNWEKNNEKLEASFVLKYNRFIVILAESDTFISTQTTNQLITFIIELESELETELMDKMNACFKQGDYVQYKDLKEFRKLIKDKGVNKKTIVFDNLVSTKMELEEHWEIPASESWYGNLFK